MDYWGGGGQRVCWSPPLKLLGGLAPRPPSSYAYVVRISFLFVRLFTLFRKASTIFWEIADLLIFVLSCFALKKPGPGCSKLITSLVNVSLKYETLISQILQHFLSKKMEKLLQCKSFSNFFDKKFQCTG